MSSTSTVRVKKRKADTVSAEQQGGVRIIEALPGSTYHIPKLVVKKGESFRIKHSGGELRIDRVEVQAGGSFDADFRNAPDGWRIPYMHTAGTVVNRF